MSSKPSKSISTIVGLSSKVIMSLLPSLFMTISLKNFDLNNVLIMTGVDLESKVSPTSKGR